MENTKEFLKKVGIDEVSDDYVSPKRFGDGGQYRFEVPGIQSPKTMNALLEEADRNNIFIHRVTQTKGIMMLTDEEIKEMVKLAKDYGCELFLSVGPRATYDTSATVHTKEGSRIGYRLRGYGNLVYAIEDVKRACRLGVRGILLYDEGLLWVLNQMREDSEIPSNVHFKLSAHAGHSNPASAKLLEEMGLDSLNPVRDLQIPMLASIRNATDMVLDLHTENPKSTGGFIRHYEVPKFIQVASPVYLKTGGSVAANHNWDTTASEAIARIKQVKLVKRMIDEYCPDAIVSPDRSGDLAVPE
ncbi:peptidase [Methanobrevibacter sp.]|uniref:peptidase n=1 Tax=Methanobrevibacter sp. TaxID=66852 RepID=UPI00386616C8